MPRAKKSEDQPWLKYVVLPLLLIFFGLESSYMYLSRIKQKSEVPPTNLITPVLTPTPTPTPQKNVCPTTPWIDCMPVLGATKPECASEYLNWVKVNCPDFQGVAY